MSHDSVCFVSKQKNVTFFFFVVYYIVFSKTLTNIILKHKPQYKALLLFLSKDIISIGIGSQDNL